MTPFFNSKIMRTPTDFISILSQPMSKFKVDELVSSIINEPDDFSTLYDLIAHDDITVSWRAIWVCEKISKKNPVLFKGRVQDLADKLLVCQHDGSKRLLLSIMYNLPHSSFFQVPISVYDYCLKHMLDLKESAGVQSLSVKLAYKIYCKSPDLLNEFKAYLQNIEPEYYSTAVKTCRRNILQRIG